MKIRSAIPILLTFLAAGCAPPAPPLQTAAPSHAPCNCSITSIIFFDPGVASLSPKNLAAVQQDAALYAKQTPNPIIIAGGADTAEASGNPAISLQRAEAVAAQLEADGVPSGNIIIRDNGTQHPMLRTGVGVSQTMNRYVMTQIQVVPLATAPVATGPYQLRSFVLYQPNAMLVDRVGANGAEPLAFYLRQVSDSLAKVLAAAPAQPGVSAALVIGVKPSGAVRTWIVAPSGAFSPQLASQIQSSADAVSPVTVRHGPIAVALVFSAWGGAAPVTDPRHPVPMPKEWTQGGTGPELVPDGVFNRIWP